MAVHTHYKTGSGVQKVHEEKQKLHIIPLFKELPISILAYRILGNFFFFAYTCVSIHTDKAHMIFKWSQIENINLQTAFFTFFYMPWIFL